MKKLFEYLSEDIDDRSILEAPKKKRLSKKDIVLSDVEDGLSEESCWVQDLKGSVTDNFMNQTGVESACEINYENSIANIISTSTDVPEDNKNHGYVDKKKGGFRFSPFRITDLFEQRRKEKAFHELMQAITFVIRYKDINYLGMKILINKYKKLYPNESYANDFLKKVHSSSFYKTKSVVQMQKEVKRVYRLVFAKDDQNRAKFVFKHIGRKTKTDPLTAFLVGILLTMSCVLLFTTTYNKESYCAKNVVYSFGMCHLGALLFGVCLFIFENYGINYKLIFNFDVVSSMDSVKYELTVSCLLFSELLTSFVLSNHYPRLTMYIILCGNLFFIFCPFDIIFYRSRLYLMGIIAGMIGSIFKSVFFKHFFFADVCLSFSSCFSIIYSEFFPYNSRMSPVAIAVFFALLKLVQCLKRYRDTREWFPHLINMGKYLLVSFSTLISCFFALENTLSAYFIISISFLASSFNLIYDFTFDWSLGRKKMIYPKYFYCTAIVYNIFARFFWIVKLFRNIDIYFFIFIEIIRRFVWTIIRVENEHINNCRVGKSKADMFFSNELFYNRDTDKKQIVQDGKEELV